MAVIDKVFSDKVWELIKMRQAENPNLIQDMLGLKPAKLVYYPFIKNKGLQDVRKIFVHTEDENKELLEYYARYVTDDMEPLEKARAIALAVNSRLKYVSDIDKFGQSEYWARPIEVHRNKMDDCDGYACLMVYVLRLLGFKEYEVFVRAGYVQGDGRDIGHASGLVLDTTGTFQFYPLEGSYYAYRCLKELGQIPIQSNDRYHKTWWITNDKVSYSDFPWLRFIK